MANHESERLFQPRDLEPGDEEQIRGGDDAADLAEDSEEEFDDTDDLDDEEEEDEETGL